MVLFSKDEDFMPIVKPYEYIAIIDVGSPLPRDKIPPEAIYEVVAIEPVPTLENAYLLGPNAKLEGVELKFYDVDSGTEKFPDVGEYELLHLRVWVAGYAAIRFYRPRGTARYQLRDLISYIDPRSGANWTELFHKGYKDRIYMTIINLRGDRKELVKIYARGWRLVLEPAKRVPEVFTPVYLRCPSIRDRLEGE